MINSGQFDGLDSKTGFDRVAEFIEQKGIGKRSVKYRLRDWLISRQRYWGCPIPVVHCEVDGIVAVPRSELPVLLRGVQAAGRQSRFLAHQVPEVRARSAP